MVVELKRRLFSLFLLQERIKLRSALLGISNNKKYVGIILNTNDIYIAKGLKDSIQAIVSNKSLTLKLSLSYDC